MKETIKKYWGWLVVLVIMVFMSWAIFFQEGERVATESFLEEVQVSDSLQLRVEGDTLKVDTLKVVE